MSNATIRNRIVAFEQLIQMHKMDQAVGNDFSKLRLTMFTHAQATHYAGLLNTALISTEEKFICIFIIECWAVVLAIEPYRGLRVNNIKWKIYTVILSS